MKEPLITFIIPCYNGGKYISNIVREIESSHFRNFEVIIVNDGSTDNTSLVCQALLRDFNNIEYILNSNGGASSARNTGLKQANGRYVCFVDCDDHFYGENLALIAERINNQDLILLNVVKATKSKIYRFITQKAKFSNKESLISDNQFINAPWGRLIKRDLIERYNLYFDTSLKVSEDLLWCCQLLQFSEHIECINIDMYMYVTDNANSTTNSIDESKIDDLWIALNCSFEECSKKRYCDACLGLVAYHYMMNLAYSYSKYDEYKFYINQYRFLLKYDFNKRVKVVKYLSNLFGLKVTSKFLNYYMRNK